MKWTRWLRGGSFKHKTIVLMLGIGLFLTGCSKDSTVVEVGVYTAENIAFEDGTGSITVIFEEPIIEDNKIVDGIFDVIVLAKELDPKAKYEIYIKGNDQSGVLFGPEDNVELKLGTMAGETTFQPNENGELYVSMQNPLRIVSKEEEVRVIVSEDGKEVLRSNPFRFETKN